ncbi:Gram-negative bacterial tonB protein [compost metagenome]
MKKITFVILILLFSFIVKAQEEQIDNTTSTETSAQEIRIEPEFPGGLKAFYEYLGVEIKKNGLNKKRKGKILIQFIVERDGSINEVTVLKGIEENMDKKVCEIIARSPKWSPGTIDGVAIRASYNMPITLN